MRSATWIRQNPTRLTNETFTYNYARDDNYKEKRDGIEVNLPIVNESNNVVLDNKRKELRLFLLQGSSMSTTKTMVKLNSARGITSPTKLN